VLTDNGIQFADLPKNRQGPTARLRGHRSTGYAIFMESTTALPNQTTPGPTDRSSA
jgi:hypothetical protein